MWIYLIVLFLIQIFIEIEKRTKYKTYRLTELNILENKKSYLIINQIIKKLKDLNKYKEL